jgi:hypothetical protein
MWVIGRNERPASKMRASRGQQPEWSMSWLGYAV